MTRVFPERTHRLDAVVYVDDNTGEAIEPVMFHRRGPADGLTACGLFLKQAMPPNLRLPSENWHVSDVKVPWPLLGHLLCPDCEWQDVIAPEHIRWTVSQ